MKPKVYHLIAALLVLGIAVGCQTSSTKSEDLTKDVQEAKAMCLKSDPNLAGVLSKAAGYVVFPSVGKGAVGVGGATGKGQLFAGGGQPVGEASLTQLTIGFQFGGQVYTEIVIFQDQTTLDNFKKGNFEFSAQTTAVALKAGASLDAKYEKGVMVFTEAKGGLMYEASIGGQKFNYSAY